MSVAATSPFFMLTCKAAEPEFSGNSLGLPSLPVLPSLWPTSRRSEQNSGNSEIYNSTMVLMCAFGFLISVFRDAGIGGFQIKSDQV